ncbi:hypothetical protein O6H91_09G088900 [Diphasiastrum complanatum]|uniref:Uncharacterized protein n=2 Tax=Diphasiastrum complanatum TaxID=34168 RepID=A0ACC2CRI9_DIPCM|nr:hypothetical protein O6H91_09G088900 [Diphasiastrum complanatum]KAJ7544679.1 hypothetical protein O6H91_09G088900 [Diphasiastrum complanatum]
MRAYARNERPREALDCFSHMQIHGIKADPHTWELPSLGALGEGQQIHAAIVDSGCEGEVIVATALVNMYGKCRGVQHVRRVFSQMPERNVVTWNAMISAFSHNGYAQEAFDLFHQMQYNGFTPDHITVICIVDACGDFAALDKGQQIHATIIERGYEGHLVVGNALVNMYGKCQSLHDAHGVFRRMQKHNVVSWNTMISACAQNGHRIEALETFHNMDSDGIRPNEVTFLCALDACAGMANLHEEQKIHAGIVKSKYEGQLAVGNALINMYGKCNSLQNALNVFNQMPQRNVISWTTIISACTQNGCCKEALDYYDQMQKTSLKPNRITFLGALDACTKLAALEKGQEIHGTIIDGGYEGLTMVGNALITMYGQCRALQDAKSVFGRTCHRDVISWNSMIAACTWNGRGKEALDYFDEMQRYASWFPRGGSNLGPKKRCSVMM